MINQKIIEYIQQNLDGGYDVAAIRKRLIDHGYPQSDIDDTINHVQQQPKDSQKANDGSKLKRFRIIISSTIIILVVAIALGTYFFIRGGDDSLTGRTATATESIYEDGNFSAEKLDVDWQIRQDNGLVSNESEEVLETSNGTLDIEGSVENLSEQQPETAINETPVIEQPKKAEEFKFNPTSIVNKQNNVSIAVDNIKHEIKSEYWGKIIEITTTILNNGSREFKPKVLVILYDEADFKEEWLKPKAEIQFDIEKLNIGEHVTRQAIVNIAFDNLTLTKNFKLVLVDSADPANHPIVVVEKDFNALNQ